MMITPARIIETVTVPAGDPVPATRRARARDVTPGMVTVRWSDLDARAVTRLHVVVARSTLRGRVVLDDAHGGRSSCLPDTWVQVRYAGPLAEELVNRVRDALHARAADLDARYAAARLTGQEDAARHLERRHTDVRGLLTPPHRGGRRPARTGDHPEAVLALYPEAVPAPGRCPEAVLAHSEVRLADPGR